MIPTMIPTKMVAIFGALRRFSELPIIEATRLTFSSGPTTMIRSPTIKRWLRPAKRSIPCRLIRVTFTPYTERKCISPNVLPLILLLVITIRRLTNCCGWSSSCQSTSISGPMKARIAAASPSALTTRISSPNSKTLSKVGTDNTPSCIRRVQTKSRLRNSDISSSLRPAIYAFCTFKYIV